MLDALIYVDMTTGPAGQSCEFDRRIDEILERQAESSEVHTMRLARRVRTLGLLSSGGALVSLAS
ncbi:hypothetical protein [Streptomyces bacillaris]|uniref:hypothetical protein n=1 Tax=Streptomyces bacillaris TaxID=68179 RepID=UPI0036F7DEE0